MNQLPINEWITKKYCNRWAGRLVVDGKYIKVKGYDKKIPFIYGIDYLTHDIPVGLLAPSENELSYIKFFKILKEVGYHPQIIIADDNGAIRPALFDVFPHARFQLCQVHYLENIRQQLGIRTQEQYRDFFYAMHRTFNTEWFYKKREAHLRYAYQKYGRDEVVQTILVDIMKRQTELFAYSYRMKYCPNTTNLIESYNSHMQARLKSIKSFQSFKSAQRWLNAWMLRRRTKPFTDCAKPFKHLNGKMSIQMSLKKEKRLDEVLKLIY